MSKVRTLHLGLASSGWIGVGPSSRSADDQPVQLFVKEVIKAGRYVDPRSKKPFEVSTSMLDAWEQNFERMLKAGHKVFVPEGHTSEPSKNRGWVDSLYRDGDSLMSRIALVGDAAKLVSTNDVSVYAVDQFTDGAGNKYEWPILHVALTPTPVVPGLRPFEKIAASFDGHDAETLVFARSEGDPPMEGIQKVAQLLGINTEGMSPEQVEEAVRTKLEEIDAILNPEKPDEGDPGKPQAPPSKVPDAIAASHPTLIKLAAKNREHEIQSLVTEGRISKAVGDKLRKTWIGKDQAELKLSMDEHSEATFEQTIAALRENPSVYKVSGPKTLALAREEVSSKGTEVSNDVDRLLGHIGQKRS